MSAEPQPTSAQQGDLVNADDAQVQEALRRLSGVMLRAILRLEENARRDAMGEQCEPERGHRG